MKFSQLGSGIACLLVAHSVSAQDLSYYELIRNYDFGTSAESTVSSVQQLSESFKPYGVAGTTVINREWQRYQPFNSDNHVFTDDDLELTALPNLGGVFSGGISSGQITTKEVFYPRDGAIYAFRIRARVPNGRSAWPAFWMYSPGGPGSTTSEIDIFEFFDSPTQNSHDWTGYDHGNGVGNNFYSIMTNRWVWHPGFDFASDYHTYTLVWKEGVIQKWVDNTLVKGTYFDWYGPDPQVLINLAVGGSINNNPVTETFPSRFLVDYFQVFRGDAGTEDEVNMPGVIQAENFSLAQAVRLQGTSDEGGGQNVGWLDNGDWIDYSVVVDEGGLFRVQFRVSGWSNNAKLQIKMGDLVLSEVTVPNTGGFQNWITLDPVNIVLLPGVQTIRLQIVGGNFNINWMRFE